MATKCIWRLWEWATSMLNLLIERSATVCVTLASALAVHIEPPRPSRNPPFWLAEARQISWDHSVELLREVHSARSEALAIPSASNTPTSSWSSLGLICPRVSSEVSVEVILCQHSRQPEPIPPEDATMLRTQLAVS